MALAARGPAVVELLLEAVLGDVYDPDGPASERAAETIDELPRGEACLGLTEVLCGDGDDALKGAAVDGLVALGGLAEPDLVAILDDPEGGEWAAAALEQIRFEFEHPGAGADDELEDEEPDDDADGELDDDGSGGADAETDAVVDDAAEGADAVVDGVAGPGSRRRARRGSGAGFRASLRPRWRRGRRSLRGLPAAVRSRTEAASRRPNVAQCVLNTGFTFTCESSPQAKNGYDGCPPDRLRVRLSHGAPPPSRSPASPAAPSSWRPGAVGPSGPRRAHGARRGPSPFLGPDLVPGPTRPDDHQPRRPAWALRPRRRACSPRGSGCSAGRRSARPSASRE